MNDLVFLKWKMSKSLHPHTYCILYLVQQSGSSSVVRRSISPDPSVMTTPFLGRQYCETIMRYFTAIVRIWTRDCHQLLSLVSEIVQPAKVYFYLLLGHFTQRKIYNFIYLYLLTGLVNETKELSFPLLACIIYYSFAPHNNLFISI